MKILLDLRCLGQAKTGIQIVAANFLNELLDHPSRTHLRVLAGEGAPVDPRLEERQIIRSRIAPYDFRRQNQVAAMINQLDADLVLSPTYFMPFGVRKPYIVTVHDLIPRKVWLGASSLYYWAFLGSRMRRALAVWTVSDYSRLEILRHYPELGDRIQVVPSGYATHLRSAPEEKKERGLLLFASRFRHKNVPFALQAFKILQELSANAWTLHVVGDVSRLRDAALPENVWVHGRVADHELTELYRRCWGVLLPSVEEGFSLPLLDGMSHGCLVFYHRQTAMQETAGDAGIGLDLGRPEVWAKAILAAAANAEGAMQQRTHSLRRAAEFTRERFTTALNKALAVSLKS